MADRRNVISTYAGATNSERPNEKSARRYPDRRLETAPTYLRATRIRCGWPVPRRRPQAIRLLFTRYARLTIRRVYYRPGSADEGLKWRDKCGFLSRD